MSGQAKGWRQKAATTSVGTFLEQAALVDEADKVGREVERKYGPGAARLMVGAELRTKFDRQRYLFNQAVWAGGLEAVRRESGRMIKAWQALDKACAAMVDEFEVRAPQVWECAMDDGRVLVLARDNDELQAWASSGRQLGRACVAWSLDEVARMVASEVWASNVKQLFPGASIEAVRPISDPLRGIDSVDPIDEIPFG